MLCILSESVQLLARKTHGNKSLSVPMEDHVTDLFTFVRMLYGSIDQFLEYKQTDCMIRN